MKDYRTISDKRKLLAQTQKIKPFPCLLAIFAALIAISQSIILYGVSALNFIIPITVFIILYLLNFSKSGSK